mmetsp:Transcript_27519/g.77138  ORF Transcript_27519/g.77138 Transcript_27519/m.77138 type:complete len:337 (+) Transcript_27519:86-1096(+)|eukprot:CAMPEP_0119553540 /NCGR_PEP_ID=MMETSP1352-20130426/6272_1 /TAXON_ID=265584 /ORGANISM="Stauroneis constricta, Strain CCMP1120" /LENGTH=336 /DNA_ID=CAMNT_0007599971 /DNA_START=69 /DNA_END=1079 /DNA_ORIENTATION=-
MPFKKKLEGVRLTKDLEDLVERCHKSLATSAAPSSRVVAGATKDNSNDNNHDDNTDEGKDTFQCKANMEKDAAVAIIERYYASKDESKNPGDVFFLPIPVVQAMQVVWRNDSSQLKDGSSSLQILNQSLRSAPLVFTAPPEAQPETKEQARFRKRMDRLRLYKEEKSYRRLTTNIDTEKSDDITAKSMTYAASVGLNMIIAPLSFGCFMYFFAGSLLDWIFGGYFDSESSTKTQGGVDIKRVMIGVISGVVMLFIEMILFVIRTHEFELHNRKKEKKNRKKAFGHYSSNTPRDTTVPIESGRRAKKGSSISSSSKTNNNSKAQSAVTAAGGNKKKD